MQTAILAILVGVPAIAFWILVVARVARLSRRSLTARLRFAGFYLAALWATKRPRGALTIARQRDWEDTIGLHRTGG